MANSFENAVKSGSNGRGDPSTAWRNLRVVKEQQVKVEDSRVAEYQVDLLGTFVLA